MAAGAGAEDAAPLEQACARTVSTSAQDGPSRRAGQRLQALEFSIHEHSCTQADHFTNQPRHVTSRSFDAIRAIQTPPGKRLDGGGWKRELAIMTK